MAGVHGGDGDVELGTLNEFTVILWVMHMLYHDCLHSLNALKKVAFGSVDACALTS
jgi:hypothetical protein